MSWSHQRLVGDVEAMLRDAEVQFDLAKSREPTIIPIHADMTPYDKMVKASGKIEAFKAVLKQLEA